MQSSEPAPAPFLADCALPYCKGCGHSLVVRSLADAMQQSGLAPEHLCIVSDIGCVGLIDRLFPTVHTVHTTHGRSTAFATGLAVADGALCGGRTRFVVVIGDGGSTIGLLHLVAAAQLNVDVTVVLHNNHVYGMTGGQASGMSPEDWNTVTTPDGNPLLPLDMMGILRAAGAGYLARELATSRSLTGRLVEAMAHPGFSLVEVIEVCTAFGTKLNRLTGPEVRALAERTGEPLGLREQRLGRRHYAEVARPPDEPTETGTRVQSRVVVASALKAPLRVVVAGTAGERVQSAAALCARLATAAGLYATQKNDNLVTQGTGYSLSEMILSPSPIHYTGIDAPDAILAVSADGWNTVRGLARTLAPGGVILVDDTIPGVPEGLPALVRLPLRREAGRDDAALAALAWLLARTGALPPQALADAAVATHGEKAAGAVRAIAWGAAEANRGGD